MLVLSRRPTEKIVFPDLQIVVQVLEIKGDRVRLGFEAPASVSILRGELVRAATPASTAATEPAVAAEPPLAARPPLLRRVCSATLRSAMAATQG
jgi:carbon storage regulator